MIQRLIVMTEGNEIDVSDLPPHMKYSADIGRDFNQSLQEVEKEHIRNVLLQLDGNKSRAAEVLGIDRKTLRLKLNKYNLDKNGE
jgi:DNA-binding NtrC family response regulator